MEKVGTQVKIPVRQAFKIAMQGIRIRLGRAIVTISGVVLGIAFLMSSVTSQLVKQALAKEREIKRQVELMNVVIKNEMGSLSDKTIAVIICGELSVVEEQFLRQLLKKTLIKNVVVLGNKSYLPSSIVEPDTSIFGIIVLGNGVIPLSEYSTIVEKALPTAVILDTLADRNYPEITTRLLRKESFFASVSADMGKVALQKEEENNFRVIWIGIISMLVTIISITNALLMSVTERFREIGTLKCLGALSSFIRQLFLIESAVIGITGSIIGVLFGAVFSILMFSFLFSFGAVLFSLNYLLLGLYGIGVLIIGTLLSVIAAIYPANFAARMVPATALRTNV